ARSEPADPRALRAGLERAVQEFVAAEGGRLPPGGGALVERGGASWALVDEEGNKSGRRGRSGGKPADPGRGDHRPPGSVSAAPASASGGWRRARRPPATSPHGRRSACSPERASPPPTSTS